MSKLFQVRSFDADAVQSLDVLINEIQEHEAKTVSLLGEALPLTLEHIWSTTTVGVANKLMGALSPTNKKAALVFFKMMQPHAWEKANDDKRKMVFGKRIDRNHTLETKANMERFFSLDPELNQVNPDKGYFGGDYWLWENTVVEVEGKDVNYFDLFGSAFDKVLDSGASTSDVLTYLMTEKGVDITEFMAVLKTDMELKAVA